MIIIKAFGLEEGTEIPSEAVVSEQIHPRQSKRTISKERKAVISLIAGENIPFTQFRESCMREFYTYSQSRVC